MPPGLHVRYLAWFHIKKYASSVCLKDLNSSGELSGRGPFRPGAGKTVREEDRFHYWEKMWGSRQVGGGDPVEKGNRRGWTIPDKLDHPQRICYHHFLPDILNC